MSDSDSVRHIPSHAGRLVVQAEFPRLTPTALFDYFVRPHLLTQWWPASASVEPRLGGRYHMAWPAMGWNLRGEHTAFAPPARLAFTWHWDHEPAMPVRQVDLSIEAAGGGSRLTVMHSAYGPGDAEQSDRVSHLEGWRFFLGRLQAL
jgi:uncharacterized protein YndB with AHSA1/START domain